LAAVCSGQAGGQISLYRVQGGRLRMLHEALDRGSVEWSEPTGVDLADASASLAFSPDSRCLAVYAASPWAAETRGWQGEILLYDIESGRRVWHVPIDCAILRSTGTMED